MKSCVAFVFVLVLMHLISLVYTATCPKKMKIYGKMCYSKNSQNLNWHRANQACKRLGKGGQLATISGKALNDYLFRTYRNDRSIFSSDVWIGVQRKNDKSPWVYADGRTTVKYTNWYFRPSVFKHCVEMNYKASWDSNYCRVSNPSICELPAEEDECALGTHTCHAHATCKNTFGSYNCTCNSGYAGDGMKCQDVNECTSGSNKCHTLATCTNTIGSYTCTCPFLYTGDGKISCTKSAVRFTSSNNKILQELGKHDRKTDIKLTNIKQLLLRLLQKPLSSKKPAPAGK